VSQFPNPYPPEEGQDTVASPPSQRPGDPGPAYGQAYGQPANDAYGPPAGQPYSQPGQAYGQPGEAYGQPGQAYSQPGQQPYTQPGDAYGQPTQAYGQPGAAYSQPTQGLTPAPAIPANYAGGPYQGAVPAGMYVDQASGLLLPDGTQLASPGRRIGAWFLSLLLVIVTLGIGYVVWGLLIWSNGQSPALQVLGMRVWRPETNRVAGFWYMALREIVGRIVDGILSFITEITSFVMFVASKDHKSLHDQIAGTVVLYDPNKVLAR
jgi:uncharacterized RDD family membrane protein YckC